MGSTNSCNVKDVCNCSNLYELTEDEHNYLHHNKNITTTHFGIQSDFEISQYLNELRNKEKRYCRLYEISNENIPINVCMK